MVDIGNIHSHTGKLKGQMSHSSSRLKLSDGHRKVCEMASIQEHGQEKSSALNHAEDDELRILTFGETYDREL